MFVVSTAQSTPAVTEIMVVHLGERGDLFAAMEAKKPSCRSMGRIIKIMLVLCDGEEKDGEIIRFVD